MIKVGLIGVGKIAKTFHLPAWAQLDKARVLALVDPRIDEARQVGREFGITNVFRTMEDMLDVVKLDAVDICSPHMFHADHACKALEAGLHCIIEKPFATDKTAGSILICSGVAILIASNVSVVINCSKFS